MRLKRVRIFGFKTFAERSEFSLDGGVVAVIGPNGCGKSNLVDAILWGLGEGNSRHLRAQTGQDVIFSGSARRKALGYAEVTLLFDNEDGSLPIDTPEVTVTRRVTRGGESEYSINRRGCRLRDIHDLLADSGLGRAGYSIVGQKEIDAAVSASAEDRRAWIDEAAGVQRYRARKIESLRRLEQAQDHLSRVADILTELEAQREPLRNEAELATRYRSVLESLREIEMGQLIAEVCKAVRDVREAEERIQKANDVVGERNRAIERLEAEIGRFDARMVELDANLDAARQDLQGHRTAEERAISNIRVLEERSASLDQQQRSYEEDAQGIAAAIEAGTDEVAKARVDWEREQQELHQLQTDLGGHSEATRQLQNDLRTLDSELTTARRTEAARLKLVAEAAHREERRIAAERELKGVDQTIPGLQSAIAEAEAQLNATQEEANGLDVRVKAIDAEIEGFRDQEVQAAQANRTLLAERAAIEGRIRGIEATIDAHEGLTQGSRAVLQAVDQGELTGSYVPVGQVIEADRDVALAIETALGGAANDLIVDRPEEAKRAIEWLKQRRAGRATFQPIPLMKPSHLSTDILGKAGVVGRASDLVSCDARYQPVIDSLLGRIVVVETIDDALRHAKSGGWSRLVTLQGEVQHSGGAVTGGQHGRQSYGLVQRKADLLDLEDRLAECDTELEAFERGLAQRVRETESLQSEAATRKAELAELLQRRDEERTYLRSLQDELKGAVRDQGKLRQELLGLEPSASQALDPIDLAGIELRRDTLLRELAAKGADADQAEARLREREARVRDARHRVESAERRLQQSQEMQNARTERLKGIGPERVRLAEQVERARTEQSQAHRAGLDAEGRMFGLQGERRELAETSRQASNELKALRDDVAAVADATHQAELARARAETRRANSQERLIQDYGLSEDEALEQEGRHELPPDSATVVGRLRRELKAMGDVNLGAIEAFERLSQRLDELGAQRADILEGIEHVEASIRELDKLTRHRFVSTFEAVQAAFAEMFLKLFGGGEGSISLSTPDRILESGVDLMVQLPGKKRQPLQLLSGGERSLCASAFLFALLKVKPSPLVVLDEVDAPLDGANVERFAHTLSEFSEQTQFIVITHNTTTIETIPIWLGVSMQEPGVSSLLPTSLPGRATREDQGELSFQN